MIWPCGAGSDAWMSKLGICWPAAMCEEFVFVAYSHAKRAALVLRVVCAVVQM